MAISNGQKVNFCSARCKKSTFRLANEKKVLLWFALIVERITFLFILILYPFLSKFDGTQKMLASIWTKKNNIFCREVKPFILLWWLLVNRFLLKRFFLRFRQNLLLRLFEIGSAPSDIQNFCHLQLIISKMVAECVVDFAKRSVSTINPWC